jgi:hypothetical protein
MAEQLAELNKDTNNITIGTPTQVYSGSANENFASGYTDLWTATDTGFITFTPVIKNGWGSFAIGTGNFSYYNSSSTEFRVAYSAFIKKGEKLRVNVQSGTGPRKDIDAYFRSIK